MGRSSQWGDGSGKFCRPCSSLSPCKRGQNRLNRSWVQILPHVFSAFHFLGFSSEGKMTPPFFGFLLQVIILKYLKGRVEWAVLTSSIMWIWALIFMESLVRLSLSLEKRNKKGQSGSYLGLRWWCLPHHFKKCLHPGWLQPGLFLCRDVYYYLEFPHLKTEGNRASEMAQHVKVIACQVWQLEFNSQDPDSGGENWLPKVDLLPLHVLTKNVVIFFFG